MLSIEPGDVLVISGKDYPIRSIAQWTGWGSDPSFAADAVIAASTKRPPTVDAQGQRGAAETSITSFMVTRFDVVEPSVSQGAPLDLPYRLLRCFAADATDFVELTVEERFK
jgi:hypothetical protein